MEIKIITESITKDDVREMAQRQFSTFVKAVVDIQKGIMAVGGEWHRYAAETLIKQGSAEDDLWGINLHPDKESEEFVEFNSMINIRPSQGNASRNVESAEVRQHIMSVVERLMRE